MNFEFSKLMGAKSKDKLTWTVCGNPEYSPPELFLKKGVSESVDRWQLGCFIYELLIGESPLKAADPIDLYENILYKSPNWNVEPLPCDVVHTLLDKKRMAILQKKYDTNQIKKEHRT